MKDYAFNMVYDPKFSNKLTGKSYMLASAVTERTDTYGDAYTGKELEPAMYLRSIVDAAKERMRFLQVAAEYVLPEGNADFIIPRRTNYLADSSWNTSAAEYTGTDEIDWTAITTMDGIQVTPVNYNYGVALTNDAIRRNLIQLVQFCRDELGYKYEYSVDSHIRDKLLGTVHASTSVIGPVEMSDTVLGSQVIFGGDATDASDSLDAGDTLTTDMVALGRRLLQSTKGYWYDSNTWSANVTVPTNSWEGPFVMYIAPEQEEALVTDSQFVNAAEYGGREVILGGEIGKTYLGVKIISTTKTPAFDDNEYYYIGGATNYQVDTTGHVCAMVKPQVCGGMVWGRKARFQVYPWPDADQTKMTLNMVYGGAAIQSDAIIRMVVNDE